MGEASSTTERRTTPASGPFDRTTAPAVGGVHDPVPVSREIGRIDGGRPGPLLLCVAALHGNEPAGVRALERVLAELGPLADRARGTVLGLVGNRRALAVGRRFLGHDLNRAWTRARLGRGQGAALDPERAEPEDLEQRELLTAITALGEGSSGRRYLLDLHTTSGDGGAFTTASDTLANRDFSRTLPVPLVLGLEELVEGTLLEHLEQEGWIATAFEAGRHEDPRSVDRAAAAVRIAIAAAGVLSESDLPGLAEARKLLAGDSRRLPAVLEMRHRHAIEPSDAFRMRPGYGNFHRIRRGEPLGRDREGDVRAPEDGRILMPLYQEQGDDGFFVVREFAPFWLHVSRLVRHLRLDRVVHWLPGIRRHPERRELWVVDRRVARWYALQVMHLLGFRKHREHGDRLLVVRRTGED